MARWPQRRWDLFASALAVNMAAGCTYDYSVYSPAVKATFGLSLRETDLVMNFAFFFYAATSYGYSICNQRLGPKRAPRLGCLVMLTCYSLLVYHLLRPIIPGQPGAALMSLLMGIGWAGQATSLGAGFQRVVEIFPESSGIAVGILKTSLGAGGALAPAIFFGLWGQRPPENVLGMKLFPGFANICLAIAVIALTCSVDAQPGCSPHEGRLLLGLGFAVVLITAAATAYSLLPVGMLSTALLAATIVLLVGLFLSLAWVDDKQLPHDAGALQHASSMHVTVWQASRTTEYWMYLLVFCICAGSGQLVLTNVSQMADALGFASRSEALICCFSFCNMLGRLSSGVACDVLQRQRTSRTVLFVMSTSMAIIGQLLLHAAAVYGDLGLLFLGVMVVGLAFGSCFPTVVNVCAARWGAATLNGNWTLLDAVGNGIASILFGSYLGSLSYDLHAGSDQKCHGPKCFALPHLIMAGASFVGTVISVLLILSQPYHRRIRQSLSAVNLGNTESFPLNQIGSD